MKNALAKWQDEVAKGLRTTYQIDDLARAACHEAQARDYRAWGTESAAKETEQKAAAAL